jgi:hypothetical protein
MRVAAAIALLVAVALGALLVITTRIVTDRSLRRGAEDLRPRVPHSVV